jgi:hypothetical protein
MNQGLKIVFIILLTGVLAYISCKKEYSCENCRGGNKFPVAVAGNDTTIILPADSVIIDGSASFDRDGSITSYQWTNISGPVPVAISNASSARSVVKNLIPGSYRMELKVTDNGGLSAKDTMTITVDAASNNNHPPVANAGADQTITLPANSVNLDGSTSFDPDNNITAYVWTKISGPSSFTIANPNAVQTTVTNLVQGIYRFELKVTDAGGLFSKDTMQVVVDAAITNNHPPVADAGINQTVLLPVNTVNLDGSGSSDPDNNIISYTWTKVSGPPSFNIANPNAIQTQITNLVQGVYHFELKVTDAGGLLAKDTMNVCVSEIVSGQEIIYHDFWGCNDLCADGDVYWNSNQNECNPYIDLNMSLQVSIQLGTSGVWIDVHKFDSPLPPINQFYWLIEGGFLWVRAYDGSLISTALTIKVDFL